MSIDHPTVWTIDRYARLANPSSGTEGQWKYYDDRVTPLFLTISDYDILILTQGTVVRESFNLAMNGSTLRGLVRTDSLLIAYKCKNSTRQFRLRFKPHNGQTGSQICEDCVSRLSGFFVIKKYTKTTSAQLQPLSLSAIPAQPTKSNDVATPLHVPQQIKTAENNQLQTCTELSKDGDDSTLQIGETMAQEVTFGRVAKCLLNNQTLGLAYQNGSDDNSNPSGMMDSTTMQQLVHICMLDPGFPAFVLKIENIISTLNNTQS